jgi:hypothetical protein
VIGFARAQAGLPPHNLRSRLEALAKNAKNVEAARTRLLETAIQTEDLGKFPALQMVTIMQRLQKLPALQVILLDEKHEYTKRRDERIKLLSLAPWQIDRLVGEKSPAQSDNGLFTELLPDVIGDRKLQSRVEQRIGLLRYVEAVRMYAAEHEGKLPGKSDDICLPLPVDPFTGKTFAYVVTNNSAEIGSPPAYRITIGK